MWALQHLVKHDSRLVDRQISNVSLLYEDVPTFKLAAADPELGSMVLNHIGRAR